MDSLNAPDHREFGINAAFTTNYEGRHRLVVSVERRGLNLSKSQLN